MNEQLFGHPRVMLPDAYNEFREEVNELMLRIFWLHEIDREHLYRSIAQHINAYSAELVCQERKK